MNLWCIHGNLQLPSVWDCFDRAFITPNKLDSKSRLRLHKENLWGLYEYSFDAWTHSFLEKISGSDLSEKPLIMGYSLGGRLAWHAILEKPDWWRGAIIIAAHPGLDTPSEKAAQWEIDREWAYRFKVEPWKKLIKEWDQLSVFGGFESGIKRVEQDYPREIIAELFTGFSKARQRYLLTDISNLRAPPMLYISGEYDTKYTEIGATLATHASTLTHVVIPGACHRVPWENTTAFKESIQYFIDSIH